MKKLIFAASIAVMLVLSGCTGGTDTTPTPVPTTAATPTPVPVNSILAKSTGASEAEWSTVSQYEFDIDEDGEDETVQLMTSAGKDKKGKILWDDSQDWALEVVDGKDIYTLYESKISVGEAYFEVFQNIEITKNSIRLLISSSANFDVKEFEYKKDKKAFEEHNTIEGGAQNRLYSSIPAYTE